MMLYVATTNPGKLRDFAFAAQSSSEAGNQPQIQPLPNLKHLPVPEETEPTFEGNAVLKAVFYSRHAPGLLVLADDSGLEVDALGGAPGVRSARYADDRAPHITGLNSISAALDVDQRNNFTLLFDLSNLPSANRRARYRCSLVAARDGAVLATVHGSVDGEILPTPRGTDGFGYDPLFILPELDLTMAELDPTTRLAFSHRGRALRNLLPLLQNVPSTPQPPRIRPL